MTPAEERADATLTAAIVETILFLDDCANRDSVGHEEFAVESEMLRHQLETLRNGKREFLLQILTAMYHEAIHRQDMERAKHLAGLYHEFAQTPSGEVTPPSMS